MDISFLVGKTLDECKDNDGAIIFKLERDGGTYELSHQQQCCENVYLEDIVGDLNDLVGQPILLAYESNGNLDPKPGIEYSNGYSWTFYNLSTNKGSVTIRFYGESNGCYSEKADLWKWSV